MKKYEIQSPQCLQINAQVVMNGFCYSYCVALLEKLKALKSKRRIFEDPAEADFREAHGGKSKLTLIAYAVIFKLQQQVEDSFQDTGDSSRPGLVTEGIACVEEFLAIFVSKPKKPAED
ncbi:MAG: hypothetical protein Q8P52_03335 [bacterium]|nr:hypothetical protein [bacterium]